MSNPVCRYIRWKGYRKGMSEAERIEAFQRNHVPFTCLLTAQPMGADNDLCAPELCGSGRSCYEAPAVAPPDARIATTSSE